VLKTPGRTQVSPDGDWGSLLQQAGLLDIKSTTFLTVAEDEPALM
jgi:hypothetical protein